MGIIVAKIPMIDKIANKARQTVNHSIVVAYNEAVLQIIDKKLTDKIIVRIGICFPIFSQGQKPEHRKKWNISRIGKNSCRSSKVPQYL